MSEYNLGGIPDDDEMVSCCSGTSDRRFGIFLVQVVITIGLFILCLIKIGDETIGCEATQLYVSLLSILTGVWLKELKVN